MSDRENQKLVAAFTAGDQAAGAALAGAMLRAQSLLVAISGLRPELQGALSAEVLGEKLKAEVIEALREGIDLSDLANELDTSDIASNIDLSDLASELDTTDIANELDTSDIASNIDLSELAGELDMDELATLVAIKLEARAKKAAKVTS